MKPLLLSLAMAFASGLATAQEPLRVLYLSDFDDSYHKYEKQADVLVKGLEERLSIDVDLVGRNADEIRNTLGQSGFAKGYDLMIYNACIADTRNFIWASNVRTQIEEHGVPTVFLHCAMHNFRKTSSQPGFGAGGGIEKEKEAWAVRFPEKPFPIWWQITGLIATAIV